MILFRKIARTAKNGILRSFGRGKKVSGAKRRCHWGNFFPPASPASGPPPGGLLGFPRAKFVAEPPTCQFQESTSSHCVCYRPPLSLMIPLEDYCLSSIPPWVHSCAHADRHTDTRMYVGTYMHVHIVCVFIENAIAYYGNTVTAVQFDV